MKKKFLLFLLLCPQLLRAQSDSTGIHTENRDTLNAAVTSSSAGNSLSRDSNLKTEVISAAGLCKMACCNLAESFENSSAVSVGYSDAVTGARQIRMLGLNGIYTQMLDENRPTMRGLAAPFGLGYIPGQWLNGIQVAKGAPSVLNGLESVTGQINMEYRKPTDEIPFFLNASLMSDLKADLNLASSLQLDKYGKWNTAILGHVSANFMGHDLNEDGFMDEPMTKLINLANRWLYKSDGGTQLRFGFSYLRDERKGGQYDPASGWRKLPGYDRNAYVNGESDFWGSSIVNQCFNAYLKLGIPLNPDNSQNLAFIGDFNDYSMHSAFGTTDYNGTQMSGFFNLLYQNQVYEHHHFTFGISALYDHYNESLSRPYVWQGENIITDIVDLGFFGEYTLHYGDNFTLIAGLRGDWYNNTGFRFSPRFSMKYSLFDHLVLRLNAGRGLRFANPLVDNIGVMSTSKYYYCTHNPLDPYSNTTPLFATHPLEDAWVFGGSLTYYLPFGASDNTSISFDYFRTQFTDQLIVDYNDFVTANVIDFYMLSGSSYTDNFQLDFYVEPIKRFSISATFRYTNAKVTMLNGGLQERPMTPRYKGILGLQYATRLNKWIFDLTLSVNGPCRLYDFMGGGESPVYPLLYLQVTHKMKGWDIYFGGENLTNFRQTDVVYGTPTRGISNFDASGVWGPLMGIKAYVGVRVTLWKKS